MLTIRHFRRVLSAVLLAALLAGCNMFAPEASQQTLQAERDSRGTEVAGSAATATVQAERLAVTIEAGGTAVGRAQAQTTRIAATLFALGTPFVDVRFITPPAPEELQALEGDVGVTGPSAVIVAPVIQPTIIGQGGAQGNAALNPPPALTPVVTSTPDPTRPGLTNLVTAAAVGADDCAAGSVSSFDTSAEGVYVVATARNLTPSNRLVARWLLDGVEQVFYEWSPRFNIQQACIWFYMPATDVQFVPGAWSVQVDLDGVAGVPVAFSVTGAAPEAAATENMGG